MTKIPRARGRCHGIEIRRVTSAVEWTRGNPLATSSLGVLPGPVQEGQISELLRHCATYFLTFNRGKPKLRASARSSAG